MQRKERITVLLQLIKRLKERGSWCGETHIQKATYFLQEMLRVNLGYTFIMYKHGPYSFELTDELTKLRADRLLKLLPKGGYGPSIVLEESPYINKLFVENRDMLDEHHFSVEYVSGKLADKKVMELERLATALYVTRETMETNAEIRTKRIRELKPHVSEKDAQRAIEIIDDMMKELAQRSLMH